MYVALTTLLTLLLPLTAWKTAQFFLEYVLCCIPIIIILLIVVVALGIRAIKSRR